MRKKPNPRNVANAAKAEELERELERYVITASCWRGKELTFDRLRKERAEWDELIASAAQQAAATPAATQAGADETTGDLSPLHAELLDSPQRRIVEQLQAPEASSTDPEAIQQRMRDVAANLEFTVDSFAHGVHALSTTKQVAERLAERSLGDAAGVLEERERERRVGGRGVDAMDALRGLARVLNGGRR